MLTVDSRIFVYIQSDPYTRRVIKIVDLFVTHSS